MDPPKLRILVGTTNYTGPPYGALAPNTGGNRCGALVNRIGDAVIQNDWGGQITISGAIDIEPGWSDFTWASTWVNYYAAISTHAYYNFGSADGCYPDPPVSSANCSNGWTQDRVWYVSRGAPKVRAAIPQIYYEYPSGGGTQNFVSKQWQRISLQGFVDVAHPGQKVDFSGLQTSWNLCGNPQTHPCLAPQDGWKELMYILNNHDPSYHGTTPSQNWCISQYSTNPASCHRTDQSTLSNSPLPNIAWSTDWKELTP